MDVRVAALVVLALSVALAGCEGSPCPSGETAISDVSADAESVTVGGSIVEFSESRIVLRDASGEALLVSLEGYDTGAASVGDCIVATGTVVRVGSDTDGEAGGSTAEFTDDASEGYDVVIRTTSVELRR